MNADEELVVLGHCAVDCYDGISHQLALAFFIIDPIDSLIRVKEAEQFFLFIGLQPTFLSPTVKPAHVVLIHQLARNTNRAMAYPPTHTPPKSRWAVVASNAEKEPSGQDALPEHHKAGRIKLIHPPIPETDHNGMLRCHDKTRVCGAYLL